MQFLTLKMNLKIFKMLRLIAAAEKDYGFETDSYNVTTLELKHPKNVISVASPVGKAPPTLPGETQHFKLEISILL